MLRILLFTGIFAGIISLSAKGQKSANFSFRSINLGGVVVGQSGTGLMYQTINGVAFKTWFTGIGVGVDNYKYHSLPLFLEISKTMGEGEPLHLYGNAGYNFALKNQPEERLSYFDNYKFKGGFFADMGVALRAKFVQKTALVFRAGYTFKQVEADMGYKNDCIGCQTYFEQYKFRYSRLVFKAGIEF